MTSKPTKSAARTRLHDLVFNRVHGGSLIYNACWEDPRIDRQLLNLDSSSRIVMITSAGCNALDYLLDQPAEIHAVDMNFRQNALLELKVAMIRRGSFPDLFEMFGIGSHEEFREVYASVRRELSPPARRFWNRNITFFDPRSIRKSFYYQGAAGAAAWLMGRAMFRATPNIKNFAYCLFDAKTLEEQRWIYDYLSTRVWGRLSSWLISQPSLMTLLGVPRPQISLMKQSNPGGLAAYVKDKVKHVLTELPCHENYFWRVYITGSYTLNSCPEYLRKANQPLLRDGIDRIHKHTGTISAFLRSNPGSYSHYVLLDHQDWLAWHKPAALREEWALILKNSRPGTKILMRSAALEVDFIPQDILKHLRFFPELTSPLHLTDRVGTYGCTLLAEVIR